jgi:hypothetical protein
MMKHIERLLKQRERIVSAPALLLVIALAVMAWTLPASGTVGSKHQKTRTIKKDLIESAELKTSSRSPGLEIIKVEKHLDEDRIYVWLRNNSEKIITAYQVGIGIRTIQTEFLQTDDSNVLRPGVITQEKYAIQAELETKGITVLSVIYEDGTAEGVSKNVEQIKQYRQGMKIERDHTLRLLKKIASAPDSEMLAQFANIESKLPALSDDQKDKLPFFVRIGYLDQLHVVVSQMGSLANKLQESHKASKFQSAKKISFDLRQELQGCAERYGNISRLLDK